MLLTTFPAEYDKDISTRIFDGLGDGSNMPWRQYFNVESTPGQYTINTTGYSGFGTMGNWYDGEPLPMDEAVHMFDNVLTMAFFGLGFKVSRNHVRYGQLRLIQRWADSLPRSLTQKYNTDHASVLNNAFSTTYTSLGSIALISASHTTAGSSTRSNINASAALTPANLEVLITQGYNRTNYRGLADPITYNKIITGPSLRRTVAKILGSDGEMGTTDNDLNTQKGMFSHVLDPFITSTTAYFLQGPTHGLLSAHGLTPTPKRFIEEPTESLIHGLAADYTYGVEFWEGISGSQGA
mgnify:CR=1 FL=1